MNDRGDVGPSSYQKMHLCLLNLGGAFVAMGSQRLGLEPDWKDLNVGNKVDVKCLLVVLAPCNRKPLCVDHFWGQHLFTVQGVLSNLSTFSFLQAKL